MDGIAKLKGVCIWAYVQRNQFLDQGDEANKVYVGGQPWYWGRLGMSPKWGLIFKVKLKRQFNDEVICWLLKDKHKESGIGCN